MFLTLDYLDDFWYINFCGGGRETKFSPQMEINQCYFSKCYSNFQSQYEWFWHYIKIKYKF